MKLLTATQNKYRGIFIQPDSLPHSIGVFNERLSHSIDYWRNQGLQVVWLQINQNFTHLIPDALRFGFKYHHCMETEIMMVYRIAGDAVLPSYATHTIGVGGIVLYNNEEVLTVVEQRDISERPNYYKFPGGMLEQNENIADGVVREIQEETGVKTEFEGLICIRHHHYGQFKTSNFYIVCLLKPLTKEIVIDESEIGKAEWMQVDYFLENEDIGHFNKHILKVAMKSEKFKSVKIDGYMNQSGDYEVYSPCK